MSEDQIRQQNLDFIYGRNKVDSKYDLDKRAYIKSAPKLHTKTIDNFTEDYLFLSPAFPCSVQLYDEFTTGQFYLSFEHALQASKFSVNDPKRNEIRGTADVKAVKRMITAWSSSSEIDTSISPSLEAWKLNCLNIGEKILRDKFFRNKNLKSLLMKTKQDGFESFKFKNSYNDTFWGVTEPSKKSVSEGLCKDGVLIGSNHLGNILLKIREEISSGDDTDNWILQNFPSLDSFTGINIHILCYMEESKETDMTESESKITDECQVFKKMNTVFLGKTDESDYIASHPSISRVHGVIAANAPQKAYFIDLGSSNGSTIDGATAYPFTCVSIIPLVTSIKLGGSTRVYRFDVEYEDSNALTNTTMSSAVAAAADTKNIMDKLLDGDDDYSKNKERENDDMNTVFVSQIPSDAIERDLQDFFRLCGPIKKLNYVMDRVTKQPKGIAFITFGTSKGLFEAISRDGDMILDSKIRIRRSTPKPQSHKLVSDSTTQSLHSNVDNKRSYTEVNQKANQHSDQKKFNKREEDSPPRRRESSRREEDSHPRRRESSRREEDSPPRRR